jgi:hypothetical protein
LVDLVVEHTNRTPESRILSVTVNGLLVRFIGFGVLLLGHITSSKEVPALRILVVCTDRLLQILNSTILALVSVTLLVVQPSELLEDLRVIGRLVQHALVGSLGTVKLREGQSRHHFQGLEESYIFLLLVDMANLEPYVLLGQGTRRGANDVLEALVHVSCDLVLYGDVALTSRDWLNLDCCL